MLKLSLMRNSGVVGTFWLVCFSIFTGGFCGILAAVVALSPELFRNPAGIILISFIFGSFVGALCSPFTVISLRLRPFRSADWLILGIVTPLICALSMIISTLSNLMFFSGLTYCVALLITWFVVPKITIYPPILHNYQTWHQSRYYAE